MFNRAEAVERDSEIDSWKEFEEFFGKDDDSSMQAAWCIRILSNRPRWTKT